MCFRFFKNILILMSQKYLCSKLMFRVKESRCKKIYGIYYMTEKARENVTELQLQGIYPGTFQVNMADRCHDYYVRSQIITNMYVDVTMLRTCYYENNTTKSTREFETISQSIVRLLLQLSSTGFQESYYISLSISHVQYFFE